MVREETRTGDVSREEATELEVDAGAEAVRGFGISLGTWDMAWAWDLTVGGGSSIMSPSLADPFVGSEAVSASLEPLDRPEAPFR